MKEKPYRARMVSNPLRDSSRQRVQRLKRSTARAMCSAPVATLIGRTLGGRIPLKGMRFDTRSDAVADKTRARLMWGFYEGAEIRLLRQHMRSTECVVDLGASLGVLTSFASTRVPPGGKVIAIEANRDLLGLIERNVKTNAPHVALKVMHGAIDYSQPVGATAGFRVARDHTGSALRREGAPVGFEAPVLNLSDVLEAEGVSPFTLLADIEGAELGLFVRDPEALAGCKQMIVEFHDATIDGQAHTPEDLVAIVHGLGFRTVSSYGTVRLLERVDGNP